MFVFGVLAVLWTPPPQFRRLPFASLPRSLRFCFSATRASTHWTEMMRRAPFASPTATAGAPSSPAMDHRALFRIASSSGTADSESSNGESATPGNPPLITESFAGFKCGTLHGRYGFGRDCTRTKFLVGIPVPPQSKRSDGADSKSASTSPSETPPPQRRRGHLMLVLWKRSNSGGKEWKREGQHEAPPYGWIARLMLDVRPSCGLPLQPKPTQLGRLSKDV